MSVAISLLCTKVHATMLDLRWHRMRKFISLIDILLFIDWWNLMTIALSTESTCSLKHNEYSLVSRRFTPKSERKAECHKKYLSEYLTGICTVNHSNGIIILREVIYDFLQPCFGIKLHSFCDYLICKICLSCHLRII